MKNKSKKAGTKKSLSNQLREMREKQTKGTPDPAPVVHGTFEDDLNIAPDAIVNIYAQKNAGDEWKPLAFSDKVAAKKGQTAADARARLTEMLAAGKNGKHAYKLVVVAADAKGSKRGKKSGESKQPGIVAKIVDVVREAQGDGATVEQIMAELVKAFPDRRPEAMRNTVAGTFAALKKKKELVVTKPKDSRRKVYSLKAA